MAPKKPSRKDNPPPKAGGQGHSKKNDDPKSPKEVNKDVEWSYRLSPVYNVGIVNPGKGKAQNLPGPERRDTASTTHIDSPGSPMRTDSDLSGFFPGKSRTSSRLSEGKVKLR